MKKKSIKKEEEMREEYDFSAGTRGKHYDRLKSGHKVAITKTDGSITVSETKLIAIAPDLEAYFPDSKSVERALRGLVALLPERH